MSRRSSALVALLLTCILPQLLSAAALGNSPDGTKADFILITIDTLRADRLGCYGYTRAATSVIDRLAEEGIKFTQASAQVPLTLPSHYSILTGTFPFVHGVRDNSHGTSAGPLLLSERLKRAGYSTGAFVGSYILDSRYGLDRGFDFYYDNFDVSVSEGGDLSEIRRPADAVVGRAMQWIDGVRGPFFAWIHLYDLHTPYALPSSGADRSPYDSELAYVDQALGHLIGFLKSKDLLEHVNIILTADHGEGLGDHKETAHGFFVYESTLHVPLIVRLPGRHLRGRTVNRLVQSVDIAPTILRLADLDVPREIQGAAMGEVLNTPSVPVASVGRPQLAYFESLYPQREFGWSPLQGARTERYKYIEAPRPELYDLQSDPGELVNLYKQKPALAAEMKAFLSRKGAEHSEQIALAHNGNQPEDIAILSALGYVAGSIQTAPASSGKDPKDELNTYLAVSESLDLASKGRAQEAAHNLEEVLSKSPEVVVARIILALQYERMGELEKAQAQYVQVLNEQPENALAAFNLGNILGKSGRLDEAAFWYKKTLSLDSQFVPAHTALGIVYRKQKHWQESSQQFRLALECGPNYTAYYNLAAIDVLHGRLADAFTEAQSAVRLQPQHAEIHNLLGSIHLMRNQLPEAEASFREALEREPRSVEALVNLARVLMKTGAVEAAREKLLQAVSINPTQPTALKLLAEVNREQ